eukprot:1179978-Prorocentrum_minimum.AAC.3
MCRISTITSTDHVDTTTCPGGAQAMVFGNMGETSGTGVLFTRNPTNGTKELYGEYLLNAQPGRLCCVKTMVLGFTNPDCSATTTLCEGTFAQTEA